MGKNPHLHGENPFAQKDISDYILAEPLNQEIDIAKEILTRIIKKQPWQALVYVRQIGSIVDNSMHQEDIKFPEAFMLFFVD